MKSCPRCGEQYPDIEGFCPADGAALVQGEGSERGRLTTFMDEESDGEQGTECPVCGGKALPGEARCNYCGARLRVEAPQPVESRQTFEASDSRDFPPGMRGSGSEFDDSRAYGEPEQPRSGHRVITIAGFSAAAIVALAAGAWFALYLSQTHLSQQPKATSPVASAPTVEMANGLRLRIQSDVAAEAPRDVKSLLKAFSDNKAGLANVYSNAVASEPSMKDGMSVRLHILPNGSVDNGAVTTSTSGNPSFDAEVVEAMTSWKFGAVSGPGMTADYPLVFAPSANAVGTVESDLNAKLASLSPGEPPEYAFSPSSVISTPLAASSPSPMLSPAASGSTAGASASSVAVGTPLTEATTIAALPPPAASVATPEAAPRDMRPSRPRVRHPRSSRREMAALPPPKPPLFERITDELRTDRRLRRVQAYTNGSVVTIFGKVFDDSDRELAERTVRNMDGVSAVINNVTTDAQQWQQDQTLITQALQNAGLNNVQVKVIGRSAYLSGQVRNDLDRERAVTVAQSAAPVKVRENLITVAIGNMFGF